jgi:hypothetical protein
MEMIVASLVNYGGVSETNLSLEVHMLIWSLWNHDFLSLKNWCDELVHAKHMLPISKVCST